jgi:hypothetical protein
MSAMVLPAIAFTLRINAMADAPKFRFNKIINKCTLQILE